MRRIDKGAPIVSFSEFVNKNHPTKWVDVKDKSRLWREHILEAEQHGLSGYTEEPLRLNNSHIDHFRKQSLFNNLIFDWNNYIVDGVDETYGAKYKDNYVKTVVDNERLINPVTEDARSFFKYELNGIMDVADNLSEPDRSRAAYTINAFNLNEASLVERRRIIINTIIDSFADLGDEVICEALAPVGFTSVVEQLLGDR